MKYEYFCVISWYVFGKKQFEFCLMSVDYWNRPDSYNIHVYYFRQDVQSNPLYP